MRRGAALAAMLLALLAGEAAPAAPDHSPLPRPRPVLMPRLLPVFAPPDDAVRPRLRPATRTAARSAPVRMSGAASASLAGMRSLWPRLRPSGLVRPAAAAVRAPAAPVATSSAGAVCGDRGIIGVRLAPIEGRLAGCGIDRPVRITSVDGVMLNRPATMDCETAKALKSWVKKGVKPHVKRLGGGVAKLEVASGYACRTRNNQPGAKVSEHGRGKAVDISAITLANGASLNVQSGWGNGAEGTLLTRMHKSACGPFGTVLGPESDHFHKDHFHLDTADHRSGPYCR
ncbi:MAG: hypothetical protein CL814_05315 [Confluentimicrobium sp.]|uniref:extensin-like domain-containing protein n=1 Tax=Actibacterium sp. TaxID=1872125 RepID=UPI000C6BF08D|nr:extensin family protein [Actibacterium sp.]MBC56337.1 hypothetical protein [Actibacterium sp.]